MKSLSKLLHLIKWTKPCANNSKNVSPIFKLDVDCLEEIFEWLSLDDLHAFGQTCLWFRHVAGLYFRQNYQSIEMYNSKDGIYTEYSDIGQLSRYIYLTDFIQFTENLMHTYNNTKFLHRLKSTKVQTLKKISFSCITLKRNRMECIKAILSTVEVVKMLDCRFEGDFYDDFLKSCKHLKRFHLQDVDLNDYEYNVSCFSSRREKLEQTGNRWLLQKYPLLEYFQLTPWKGLIIDELKEFFNRNPNIRSFSTNSNCLFQNWVPLIETNANLESLAIDLNYWPRMHLSSICEAINTLYKAGFFRKLLLFASYLDKISSEHIQILYALETLYVKYLRESECLHLFTNLRELGIFEGCDVIDMEALAKNLINIERIYLESGTSDDILAFIRYSPNLREIQVVTLKEKSHMKHRILDLDALDRERQKLIAPRKVIIYVKEYVYLKTKWDKGRTDHTFISLKRIESCKWERPFEFLLEF